MVQCALLQAHHRFAFPLYLKHVSSYILHVTSDATTKEFPFVQ